MMPLTSSTASAASQLMPSRSATRPTPRGCTLTPGPLTNDRLPAGQASDLPAWRDSLRRIQSLDPDRVHFCHHTDVIHC